jgi:predicted amino acid-binding ACT domain protein
LNAERIAGAAIDVYSAEPPKGNPLLDAKNVVLSPHLGASTREAQLAVSLEAVDALVDYLTKGEIRSAVNVVGLPAQFTDHDRAHLDLCSRMSAILSPLCAKGLERVAVTTYGASLGHLTATLARQCVADLLNPHIDQRVNLVNADAVARRRGIKLEATAHDATADYADNVNLTIHTPHGAHQVKGIVFADGRPRILAIDGYPMEMAPERTLVLIFNDDRPGVIGLVGKHFGDHHVNIADMTLSRRERMALMVLKLDEAPAPKVLTELQKAEPILSLRTVSLAPTATAP